MQRRTHLRPLLCLLLLGASGCATTAPPVWPEIEPLSADAHAATPEPLPGALRAGVAWTEDWLSDPRTYVDQLDALRAHQEALLGSVVDALRAPPISELVTLRGRAPAPGSAADPIAALAAIGAADGLDLVIVLRTRSEEEAAANGFSPLFLLLITTPVVPGYDLRVAAAAQLCALHVASGRVLSCASDRGEATERFVTPVGTRAAHRSLRLDAMQRAVRGAADGLARDLRRRAHAAPRLTPQR